MNQKRCIAVAALAAISGLAHAQSSVTLFGTMDAMAGRVGGPTTGVNALDRSTTVINGGGLSTSHWGLRGTEDLGGGTSAFFELSSFIRNDSGAAGRSDAIPAPVNVGADPYFARTSFVAMRNNDWGTVKVGNFATPMFFNSVTSNAFADSMAFSPTNLITFVGSAVSGGTAWTDHIGYESPTWSGFSFIATRSLSENRGGGNTGGRIAYANGPLALALAGQNVKKNPLTFADGTTPNNSKAWQASGSYDFGAVKLFAHVSDVVNQGIETAPLDIKYRIWDVSAILPVGNGRILAGYANRKTGDVVGPQPAALSGGNVQRRIATVSYDHFLSKRTDVYVVAMRDSTVTRTLPAPGTLVSAQGTNYGIGIRHRF